SPNLIDCSPHRSLGRRRAILSATGPPSDGFVREAKRLTAASGGGSGSASGNLRYSRYPNRCSEVAAVASSLLIIAGEHVFQRPRLLGGVISARVIGSGSTAASRKLRIWAVVFKGLAQSSSKRTRR